jgi:ketosteroid isomerase-like protein
MTTDDATTEADDATTTPIHDTRRTPMTASRPGAQRPEDLTHLFVERTNAADIDGMLDLYEPDAVMAFPPGQLTVGHAAIRALFEQMVAARPSFRPEDPLQTLVVGDLALTATRAHDEAGARAQVARRQPDGTWKRVLDRPDFRA